MKENQQVKAIYVYARVWRVGLGHSRMLGISSYYGEAKQLQKRNNLYISHMFTFDLDISDLVLNIYVTALIFYCDVLYLPSISLKFSQRFS